MSDGLTPQQRITRARMGGLTTAMRGHVVTAPAREAFRERFVNQVDPERKLPPTERARRAEAAFRLHMTRLALASSVTRGKRKAGPGGSESRVPATSTEGIRSAASTA